MPPEDDADVVIEVDADTDTPSVDAGDTLVIVDTNDDSDSESATPLDAVEIEAALDHEQRITRIEERLFSIEDDVWQAKFAAEDAQASVEALAEVDAEIIEAVDDNFEAVEDAEIDDVDDDGDDEIVADTEPLSMKIHPLFRSSADWRNK